MEISRHSRWRYLDDFTEISPSPDRDISPKWWQYLHQMTEISPPKQRNFSYFLLQYHSKKPFLAPKNCQLSPKIEQKHLKNAKKYHFYPQKSSVFCSQNPIFLPKNHHTQHPKLPYFYPKTMAVLMAKPHSFYFCTATKTDCTGRQKHLPIYTILPCLQYPIAKQTTIGCDDFDDILPFWDNIFAYCLAYVQ